MKMPTLFVSCLLFLTSLLLHAQGDSENLSCGQVSNVQIVELQAAYVHLTWDFETSDVTYRVFITNALGDTVDRDDDDHMPIFWTGLLEPSTTYNYNISVICSEDNIGEPIIGQFTTRPCDTMFSNVKAEAGPTYVAISWDDSLAAGHYIYRDAHVFITDMLGDTIVHSRHAITPFSWRYLDVNTTYGYGVAVGCTQSVIAKPVTGTFTTLPCPQLSNVEVLVGIDQVQFSWTPGEGEYPARLIINHIDGDTVWKYPTTEVGKIINNLQANTTYQYSLTSSCGHDSLSKQPIIGTFTTLPCPPVSNVEVKAGATSAYITWENTEHSNLTHVEVVNVTGETIPDWGGDFNDFNEFNEFFSSIRLDPNTTYRYSVIARCLSGDSEPVTGEFTTLSCENEQVTNVRTEVGVNNVKLFWDIPEYEVYRYRVKVFKPNGDVLIAEPDYRTDSVQWDGLNPNTTYQYSITVRCSQYDEGEPVIGTFTTLPIAQVSNVQVVAGITDVKLTWDAPEVEIAGYRVTLSEAYDAIFGSNPIVSRDVDDTYFAYNGLKPNTRYLYNIVVRDTNGNSGDAVKGSFKTLDNTSNEIGENRISVQIYPNPNTGEAVIESAEDVYMEIFSSTGVWVETKNLIAGKHIVRFSSKGVFMVRLTNNKGTTIKRVVVL